MRNRTPPQPVETSSPCGSDSTGGAASTMGATAIRADGGDVDDADVDEPGARSDPDSRTGAMDSNRAGRSPASEAIGVRLSTSGVSRAASDAGTGSTGVGASPRRDP